MSATMKNDFRSSKCLTEAEKPSEQLGGRWMFIRLGNEIVDII